MSVRATLVILQRDFPLCFNPQHIKPLMLGIDQGLISYYARNQQLTAEEIKQCLHHYVNTSAYLKSVLKEPERIDLLGEACDEPIGIQDIKSAHGKLWINQKDRTIRPMLEQLKITFPQCFIKGVGKYPILLAASEAVIARQPEWSERAIKLGVQAYTNGTIYLQSLVEDTVRVDLDGEPAGIVTQAEVAQAQAILVKRKTKLVVE